MREMPPLPAAGGGGGGVHQELGDEGSSDAEEMVVPRPQRVVVSSENSYGTDDDDADAAAVGAGDVPREMVGSTWQRCGGRARAVAAVALTLVVIISLLLVLLGMRSSEGGGGARAVVHATRAWDITQDLLALGPRPAGDAGTRPSSGHAQTIAYLTAAVDALPAFEPLQQHAVTMPTPKGRRRFVNLYTRLHAGRVRGDVRAAMVAGAASPGAGGNAMGPDTLGGRGSEGEHGDACHVVLAAHYDTLVRTEMPEYVGASDAATGVALVLSAAERVDAALRTSPRAGEAEAGAHYTRASCAVTVLFLDGGESFISWTDTDSTYGSRAFADAWRGAPGALGWGISPSASTSAPTYPSYGIDTVTVFTLFDLLGTTDTAVPNLFPDDPASAAEYRALADLEVRAVPCRAPADATASTTLPRCVFTNRAVRSANGAPRDDYVPFRRATCPPRGPRCMAVLHLVSYPFPRVWHTPSDDLAHLDRHALRVLDYVVATWVEAKVNAVRVPRRGGPEHIDVDAGGAGGSPHPPVATAPGYGGAGGTATPEVDTDTRGERGDGSGSGAGGGEEEEGGEADADHPARADARERLLDAGTVGAVDAAALPGVDPWHVENITRTILSFGPRTAGNLSVPTFHGHARTRAYLKAVLAQLTAFEPPRELPTGPMPTPLGMQNFSNIYTRVHPAHVAPAAYANRRCHIVLAAHYDTLTRAELPGYLGATDSAAPVALILSTARAVHNAVVAAVRGGGRAACAVSIVFFDGEESVVSWSAIDSLYGARHFKAVWGRGAVPGWEPAHSLKSVTAFALLDLLGARVCGGGAACTIPRFFASTREEYRRLDAAADAFRARTAGSPDVFTGRVRQSHVEDDHLPFLAAGVPVLHIIPWPFPVVWHTAEDGVDAVDWGVMAVLDHATSAWMAGRVEGEGM